MSYCLHPTCPRPQNPENQKVCCSCGTKLLLKSRYRATQLSSDGKFVRTFQGVDTETAQAITIKQICIPPEILRESPKRQKMTGLFNETAQSLHQLAEVATLHTPLDFSVAGNGLYLVEAIVAGETVAQRITTHGPLSEKLLRKLLEDLLPALQALHDNHLLHRDIRPENIVFDHQQGQFLLTGLGIPQLVAESLQGDIPSIGEYLVGDPRYSASEQIQGQAAPTSDLYSLGVVCLQALTALDPIDLMNSQEPGWEYQAHLTTNPISPQLKQVIDKMADPSPLDRYGRAQEALTALNDSIADLVQQLTSTADLVQQIASNATKKPQALLQSGTELVAKKLSELPIKFKI
jgi:serine/threonine protein kinase